MRVQTITYTPSSGGFLKHYGVKAQTGIWVPGGGPNPVCARFSTILSDTNGGNSYAEIGWFEDPQQSQSVYGCHYPLNDTKPRLYTAYDINGFIQECVGISDPPPVLNPNNLSNFFEPMNVHESTSPSSCTTSNDSWAFVDNGSTLINLTLTFCQAVSITNGERHEVNNSDVATSKFEGLQYYNSSQTWANWTNNTWCFDNDPPPGYSAGFDATFPSATHSEVVAANPDTKTVSPACYQGV